jgi:uridine kinase
MFIIGIGGGTGSGKSTLVKRITESCSSDQVAHISMDSYYKDNSHLIPTRRQELNFDHPSAIDFTLLEDHVLKLKKGEGVDQPVYSFISCTRATETIRIEPRRLIILEGILILVSSSLREIIDLKVFIDADHDVRLNRIIFRDIQERGRNPEKVLERYEKTVKPMHNRFIEPSKRYADIIIPVGGDNPVGINLLKTIMKQKL